MSASDLSVSLDEQTDPTSITLLPMQTLPGLNVLKNKWYWLRHGQSTANVAERIASDPATAIDSVGLTASGRQQVYDTMRRQTMLGDQTLVISSDFLRTLETAQIAVECLRCKQALTTDKRLRERYFGDWEGTSSGNYEKIWQQDAANASHDCAGTESCVQVAERMSKLVMSYEQQFKDVDILLVSHGDPLQILECWFAGRPLSQHRQLRALQTAELRAASGGTEN